MTNFWWIALAILIALTSAVRADDTDWALVAPPHEPICAKSYLTCEAARAALARGWLDWGLGPTRCEPRPNCFLLESNLIRGYNDR